MGQKIFTCFLVVLTISANAQTNNQDTDYNIQRAQLLAFNVGFNGLVGGVGAIINRHENQTAGQAFLNGLYKGAIGGTISHIGLSLTHQIAKQENISYAWPARIVNSLGSSIVQNAAENLEVFDRFHFNLFVARFEYLRSSKSFRIRIFSSSIYGIVVVSKNANLNLTKSLESGVLYWESDMDFSASRIGGRAISQVSSVGMSDNVLEHEYYNVFAHEVAHILQFDRKVGGNAFVKQLDSNWKNKYQWYSMVSKFLYFDLNGPIFYAAYHIQNTSHRCNFFEQEAENYSGKIFYGCN